MSEIDKRIAIEVMGEEEPELPEILARSRDLSIVGHPSPGGNWRLLRDYSGWLEWSPIPFSDSLEEALRALERYLVEKGFDEGAGFISNYSRGMEPRWGVGREGLRRHGQTLPEAICNLLLALVERRRK